ncbi:MAG: O-antigen ligase family protein [Verrucomicrobia bacterium]|nr:O-antigen ligase family protein [Verrucomicrobiota bacterium]
MESAGRSASVRQVLAYRACDRFSGWLICFMVVFSPWAFGTTQSWAIWTMNVTGYVLGTMLLFKLWLRFRFNYRPARWNSDEIQSDTQRTRQFAVLALAVLTSAILAYCLIAALNARSTYDGRQQIFIYHEHLSWLPHSYDQTRTWQTFFNLVALALFFWATRDWLLGLTPDEERANRAHSEDPSYRRPLPARLRRLLWILCLNGALLGAQGMAQRLSGTNQLLWFQETRLNKSAEAQFGPYAYRSNAAQYFGMVWPVGLAFWWMLRREARRTRETTAGFRRTRHHWLLPCVGVMAACPIISLSRAGALVTMGMILLASMIFLLAWRRRHPSVRFGIVLFFALVFALGAYFGWDQFSERMKQFDEGLELREKMYETARLITHDYPLFGTGPGTFEPVFQLYRASTDEYWPAQLHNDWLETRITFGWLGSALIGAALLIVLGRWFVPGGLEVRWPVPALLWLSVAGCLVHARYDFPFQVYSLQVLFLLVCVLLMLFSRRPAPSAR